jgi:hypothetical protein
MFRVLFVTKVVDRLLSYNWNYQLPPPARVMSWRQTLRSKVVKLSWKMSLEVTARVRIKSPTNFMIRKL